MMGDWDTVTIDIAVLADIKDYLLVHEYDIAIDENDFGTLENAFKAIAGRNPKEE